jgi:hypothetical protein
MKSVSNIIVFLSLIIVLANPLPAQNLEEETDFPLTIPFIKIYDKDSIYTQSMWITLKIPPTRRYKFDEYAYTLILTIVVVESDSWTEPFVLSYELPDREKGFIVVNEEQYELLPDRFNEIIVEIHTKEMGWAKFELAVYDELTGGFYVPINSYPLRRRDFLLE